MIYFLVHGFNFEYSSNANAICLHEILKQHSKNVTVFTTNSEIEKNTTQVKIVGNVKVHFIYFDNKIKMPSAFNKWIPFAREYLKDLSIFNREDRLISISNPIQINELAYQLNKLYNLKWDTYYLDPYSYNQSVRFPKFLFPYRFSKEFKHFKETRKIFLTHELYKQYTVDKIMANFADKYIELGIPMLNLEDYKAVENLDTSSNKNKTVFVYFGRFYEKIRNPKEMFKFFELLFLYDKTFELHLYGPTQEELEQYIGEEMPEFLQLKERVDRDKVKEIINTNVFLINLGNTVNNQIPSKVIEYAGTGNPILNFISIHDDTSKNFLKNYPFVLNIDSSYETADIINKIENLKGKKITKNELGRIFKNMTVVEVSKKLLSGTV